MDDTEHLKQAIKRLHNCAAVHIEKRKVIEKFQGKVIWDGEVEVFFLKGHPKAAVAYAWGYPEGNGFNSTVVLGISPVDSPESAVKIAIADHARKNTAT